jgi:hypothetical protein
LKISQEQSESPHYCFKNKISHIFSVLHNINDLIDFFQTHLSELPNGVVPGSTVVVEGATFKLNPLVERAEIGIYS